MQLLKINKEHYIGQADPFIFLSQGSFYIYTTGEDGVYAYSSGTLLGEWKFCGRVFSMEGKRGFWAPCVIEIEGTYYLYCSVTLNDSVPDQAGHKQCLFVSTSSSPLGPFAQPRQLLPPFSIDPHVIKNEEGLFLFYSTNRFDGERVGTYIAVDRLLDPFTPKREPVPVVVPTMDEEISQRDKYRKGENWHTIEGAFYFRDGEWQYVMYSGGSFEAENYFIGYARAKASETDLTKIKFEKFPDGRAFLPVIDANAWEEGTGHHSVIRWKGQYYAVYHGRNRENDGLPGDRRTARICRLRVQDGVISAERFQGHI